MESMEPQPTSTSTRGPALTSEVPPHRVRLRRQGPPHTGTRVQSQAVVRLLDGGEVLVAAGDWLISQGVGAPFDIVRAADFPRPYEVVHDAALTLSRADCEALEDHTGVGSTLSAHTLIAAVTRLARLRIGEVDIPFTPGQFEELQHRAAKRGQTLQQAVQAVIDRIKDELFWRG